MVLKSQLQSGLTRNFLFAFSLFWVLGFAILCFIIPLGAVFCEISTQSAWNALFEPSVILAVRVTLLQTFISTLISALLGLILGLGLGHLGRRSSLKGVQTLLTIPYGVPTVVAATAWVSWLGRTGVLSKWGIALDWAYSLKAVILAHAFLNIPLVALIVYQSILMIPEDQMEAVRTLGAGAWGSFRWVIWPQIRWAFLAVCAQVASLCSMSFALVLILGGGPPVQTLETELYQKIHYGMTDISGAMACGFWEICFTLLLWVFVILLKNKAQQRRNNTELQGVRERIRKKISKRKQAFALMIAAVFIFPYFIVFTGKGWSSVLDLWLQEEWRSQLLGPLQVSLILAFGTGILALITALSAAFSLRNLDRIFPRLASALEFTLGLPGGISILVLGLGFWTAYGFWIDPFEGNYSVILFLQMTLFFPLAFRILWPVTQGIRQRQWESALLLGSSPLQAFWYVEWPRWKGPLLSAFAGVVGASLGEMGAVSFFYNEKIVPLPLLISRWMVHYHFAEAQAVAGLLFLLSAGLVVILKANEYVE